MDENLSLLSADAVVEVIDSSYRYGNDLEIASSAAYRAIHEDVFTEYHKGLSSNTQRRQINDLKNFCEYLEEAKKGELDRTAEDLFYDPYAWDGIKYSLLKGYIKWAQEKGFSLGSINVRLSTVRQYCKLAGPQPDGAGVLDEETLTAILTVKGVSGKKARNIDTQRQLQNIPTRRGAKKPKPTNVATYQVLQLKKVSTSLGKKNRTQRRIFLEARDALMIGLLVEHAMRCSEVTALNVEDIDLAKNTIRFDRRKTNLEDERHLMKTHTSVAAGRYLEMLDRTTGPLFTGYGDERLTDRAINHRVRALGKLIGINNLSPHDLRHFWTFDAFSNGTPIDKVKRGGGWKSTAMVLRYAERSGIANEGVNITEE